MTIYAATSTRLHLLSWPAAIDEYIEDNHAILSDPMMITWSSRPPSTSLDETKSMMEARLSTPEEPFKENYAILLKQEDKKPKMIGAVGIPRSSERGVEVGYGLHCDYWGLGYASEALKLFIDLYWAPGRESRDTIIAEVEPENTASGRVVQKMGFTKREFLKDAFQRAGEDVKRDIQVWQLARPQTASSVAT